MILTGRLPIQTVSGLLGRPHTNDAHPCRWRCGIRVGVRASLGHLSRITILEALPLQLSLLPIQAAL
jgi:hypothetical protein